MSQRIGRRDFIRNGAVASTLISSVRSPRAGSAKAKSVAPSDQVVIGVVGIGRQGLYNMRKFLEHPECRVGAVCDVYEPHLLRAHEESGADKFEDFRHVLDRDDLDAIVISTPDHWHPLNTIMACQAGKDVYVEKPVSVTVQEGQMMVEAARKYRRVVQVGTQQRSGIHFQKAVKLIGEGALGQVTAVRSWNFGNSTPNGIGSPPDSKPPQGLNWDLWLGPAPAVPFNANRFGVHPDRWSTFRMFWDYAGGMMTDWGVHLLDIVQWAQQVEAPTKISTSGGKFALKDNSETPDTLTTTLEYPGFISTYENRSCNSHRINEHGYGSEFYGTEATLFIDRSGFEIIPQQDRENDRLVPRTYSMQMKDTNDGNYDHVGNFLSCIKSRQRPISDIEIGHHSTATCLMANISYRLGRNLEWDAAAKQFKGDAEASKHLARPCRAPWKLEI